MNYAKKFLKTFIISGLSAFLILSACSKKSSEPGTDSINKEQVEITEKTVTGSIRLVGSEPLTEIIYTTADNQDYHFSDAVLSELKNNGFLNYNLQSIISKIEIKKIFSADGSFIGEKRTFIDFTLPKPILNEKCVTVSDPNSTSYNSPIVSTFTQTISKTTPDYTIIPFQNSPYRCGAIQPKPDITIKATLTIGRESLGVCYKINDDGSQSPAVCPGFAIDWKLTYGDKFYKVSTGTLFLADSIDRKSLVDYGVYEIQGYFKGEVLIVNKATFIENGVKPVDFIPKTGVSTKNIRGTLNDAKTIITDLNGNQTNLTMWGEKPADMVDYSLIYSGEYNFTVSYSAIGTRSQRIYISGFSPVFQLY